MSSTSYVAILTKDANDYVLVSDHPAIGILHWPTRTTLERSVQHAIERLDDEVELRYGPGLSADDAPDEDVALRADNPAAAYRTVPGTERLPAASTTDKRDGLASQEERKPTDAIRDRHRDQVRVVALGQVHAQR